MKAIATFKKHGVSFEETATVFGDANGLDGDDVAHSYRNSDPSNVAQVLSRGETGILWHNR